MQSYKPCGGVKLSSSEQWAVLEASERTMDMTRSAS